MADRTTINASDNVATIQKNADEQLYKFVSLWLAALFYGLYLLLFVKAIPAFIRRSKRTLVSLVFFVSSLYLCVIVTLWSALTLYQFVQAYALEVMKPELPIMFFRDFARWDGISISWLIALCVWAGDALVETQIYRCFLIWGNNYYVILIPFLLLLLSIIINTISLVWLSYPSTFTFDQVHPVFNMVFPVNLTINLLTTGLIVHKLWREHRLSLRTGRSSYFDGLDSLLAMRIIVESASLYTLQQLLLLVLYYCNHPAQLLFHGTVAPTVGIVFLLMATRTYEAQDSRNGETGGVESREKDSETGSASESEKGEGRDTTTI
ncbi:hypothetical protein FA15DRAFT_698260 [Coprinopsis marcescibilis]|uniref:Uncharacterized protein n=1 Tax=Coprinopsis marcescibilis TaxID=230819 RepID=A0A5C3KDE7_COPMA|nr:hypothetical protein FA15DRAFT_698260 [Coprinopsis marcescibilis]